MGNAATLPIQRVVLCDFVGPFLGGVTVVEVAGEGMGVGTTVHMACRGHVFEPLPEGDVYTDNVIYVTSGIGQTKPDHPAKQRCVSVG
jgi:hypothetical protein